MHREKQSRKRHHIANAEPDHTRKETLIDTAAAHARPVEIQQFDHAGFSPGHFDQPLLKNTAIPFLPEFLYMIWGMPESGSESFWVSFTQNRTPGNPRIDYSS